MFVVDFIAVSRSTRPRRPHFLIPPRTHRPLLPVTYMHRYVQSNRVELGRVTTEAATGVTSFFSDQLWQPCEVKQASVIRVSSVVVGQANTLSTFLYPSSCMTKPTRVNGCQDSPDNRVYPKQYFEYGAHENAMTPFRFIRAILHPVICYSRPKLKL